MIFHTLRSLESQHTHTYTLCCNNGNKLSPMCDSVVLLSANGLYFSWNHFL